MSSTARARRKSAYPLWSARARRRRTRARSNTSGADMGVHMAWRGRSAKAIALALSTAGRWARLASGRRQAIVAVPCAIRQMKRSNAAAGLWTFDRVRAVARAACEAAVTLVYPPTCVACGAATGVPHTLCAACWSGMRFIERPFCERLGTPFAVDLGDSAALARRHRRSAGVRARPRGGALRRHRAGARPSPEVRRPARTGRRRSGP